MGHTEAAAISTVATGQVDLPSGDRFLPPSAGEVEGRNISNVYGSTRVEEQVEKMWPVKNSNRKTAEATSIANFKRLTNMGCQGMR